MEWSPSRTSGRQGDLVGKARGTLVRIVRQSMKDLRTIVHLRHLGYNRPVIMCEILTSHYSQLVS